MDSMNTKQNINIDGVFLNPLRIIEGEPGDVMHALKRSEPEFSGFGEAYFSTVHQGKFKGWKRHRRMVLNLVVPVGGIKFVIHDDREGSSSNGNFFEVELSLNNYQRLTVPPMVWMGFQGLSSGPNMLLNVASILHDPDESDRRDPETIPFAW